MDRGEGEVRDDDPMGGVPAGEIGYEAGNYDDDENHNGINGGDGEDNPLRRALYEDCQRRSYLDGRYFSVILEESTHDGIIVATCVNCADEKKVRGSLTASSNFTTHLQRMHPQIYEQYRAYKESKRILLRGENPQHRRQLRAHCVFSQPEFETNVSNYILESMAPLSTVEMPAFRKFFDDLEITRDNVPLQHLTRRTLGRRIRDIHTQNMADLRTTIAANADFVCTTADIWTSRNRRFLGVTAHWIDRETLGRKSAALACRRFPGTHSHATIARTLSEIHVSFGLNAPKLCATVTDNGANFVKAFKEFGVDLPDPFLYETIPGAVERQDDEDLPNDDQDASLLEDHAAVAEEEFRIGLPQHLRCVSHTLNLIATTDTIKVINNVPELAAAHFEAINRCTALWKAMRSPRNSEIMKDILEVALVRPVVTRWNSLYDAISQIVSLRDRVLQVSETLGIRNVLRENDFAYLEEYLRCMKPVAEAIDRLQGETYCYYGYLLPTLVATRRRLLQLHEDLRIQHCQPLIQGLITALETRFQSLLTVAESCQNAAIAAVSHPKFKMRWLVCLDAATQLRVRNLILRAATEIRVREEPVEVMEEEDDYFDFGQLPASQEGAILFGQGEAEIEYLRYSNKANTDLGMLRDFPIMRSLFLKYNTPLPSSAPVERLFSFATMMNLPRYNRLTDAHFAERVLSKANAKKPYL